MSRVSFSHVSKRFDDGTEAISDLTLAVEDGELLVLLGPSGCGKSTLLRMLAGLEEPSAGDIRIDDRLVNGLKPQQRNIAMVFQNYALYPHMSVRQNLSFPLKMQGLPKRDIALRVKEVADRLGLGELLDKRPGELSGGQRQRVAMGRALVRQPGAFLMDEPLSNLDAELRLQIRQDIARLQRDTGVTMLYVTHDQVEAMTLGHRIAVMKQGVVQQVGHADELYERPVNTFVAAFIGSPGMNIFTAPLLRDSRGYSIMAEGRRLTLNGSRYTGEDLSAFEGSPLKVGIRPEALRLIRADSDSRAGIMVKASAVERLGHGMIARFPAFNRPEDSVAEHCVRLREHGRLQVGDVLRLDLPAAQIRLFERNGAAL